MHRRVVLLSTAAIAVAGALVPAGSAQAGASNGFDRRPVGWSAADSWSEATTVQRYWTSRRMLAAQPLDTPAPRRSNRSGTPSEGSPWATRGAARPLHSTRGITTHGAAWSVPATRTVNAQQVAAVPNSPGLRWTDGGAVVRTTGRVFFTTAEGGNASCSGTAVTSANESVVMTAGHCVKLNGASHRNWVFVPGFDRGRSPFGMWVATRLLTTQQWNAREDINFDVAAAVVAPLQGRTLTDVVGGQGVAFNQARGRQMFSFGYPAARPFDGSRLIYCSGRTFNDTVMTQDQGLRCDMTGGSSGGPWFQGFDESTGLGYLNSVNSFKYDFAQDFMFGPFFGDEAMAVYRAAQSSDTL
ncbi:peptidase [Nonomuraea phyllanthi]|uniref:trypsin-like serine peptidase n=1 Tax=Nonomuraea phyllanthi TaxID=2219224 RepID=UPI00129368DF|nr:peptidase [Nonomuraea phyllanthi]QFY13528.1 peptidase [Nonomuraea phyllanthi]